VCFDSKLNFDDNAEFRQKDIFKEQDLSETDPREINAIKLGLNYIQMDGKYQKISKFEIKFEILF
jgi:succinyl-CoA synthetase beta subunit